MIFIGITREFSTHNNDQYNTIGAFWDEMSALYGMENLRGLGHFWTGQTIHYAIGLKVGTIPNSNFSIELPDSGWTETVGQTDQLAEIYDEIYKDGALQYEIETFNEGGSCKISYYRPTHQ